MVSDKQFQVIQRRIDREQKQLEKAEKKLARKNKLHALKIKEKILKQKLKDYKGRSKVKSWLNDPKTKEGAKKVLKDLDKALFG